MKFLDSLTIYRPSKNAYGDDIASGGDIVPAVFQIGSGFISQSGYDVASGSAVAYLDATNAYLKSVNYEIEGYFAKLTTGGSDAVYRIQTVAVGRKTATTGKNTHIEVTMERVVKEAV